jgi:hypothetical protein
MSALSDKFTVLLALLCDMNGNKKRRQVLDLTALTGLRGSAANVITAIFPAIS